MKQTSWIQLALAVALMGGGCVEDVAVDDDDDVTPLGPETPRGPGDPVACEPGAKTLHRLNRTEYARTINDLLGVDSGVLAKEAAAGFPADDVAGGFDNNADVLSTSPLLVEKLDTAAEAVALALFPDTSAALIERLEAEDVGGDAGQATGDVWNLFSAGDVTADVTATADGRYAVRVRADQQAGGPDAARLTILVDGVVLSVVDVVGLDTYAAETTLVAGTHTLTARFDNDFYDPDAGADRNLLVDFLEIEGPLGVAVAGPGRQRFVSCDPTGNVEGCARSSLAPLLARAFRRPVVDDEVTPYVGLVSQAITEGDSFDTGLRHATHAMLLSPAFVYRAEFDDGGVATHRISTHELASRLSYFLWASMPDDALFAKAVDGSLEDRDVLKLEVERMLGDDKAGGGIVDALAEQWLNTRGLDVVAPDETLYPLPDDVRAAMKQETKLVVQAFLDSDDDAKGLLDADFTFLNAALADFYGLPFDGADDSAFVRTSLVGSDRSGVLTHGAFLTANSYPFRTSPVKRGRWVVDALLCLDPGDVPPDVPPLSEDPAAGSVRERMEAHRNEPRCAACHVLMDPIGFGLESFDPTGRARTADADGYAIDDDDVFFETPFTNPAGLAGAIKLQEGLPSCFVEKIGSYTLGRGLDFSVAGDVCTIDDVTARAAASGFSLKEILGAVVESDSFQMRTPPEEL
ncbi:MAG: DUF1592 domain-containing protein [Deltaproteobacteria bacterium]|nr:DUF1592 domain-containing protein [Deltaproteobacteria bacterium]